MKYIINITEVEGQVKGKLVYGQKKGWKAGDMAAARGRHRGNSVRWQIQRKLSCPLQVHGGFILHK